MGMIKTEHKLNHETMSQLKFETKCQTYLKAKALLLGPRHPVLNYRYVFLIGVYSGQKLPRILKCGR